MSLRNNMLIFCHLFFHASFYLPDLVLLSCLHNIWQFFASVFPPSCQGFMWSASISLISKCAFLHRAFLATQIPFCRSYASRFILSLKARIERCFSCLVKT